jgi:anaerobic magnesium-protoporphyrin IX monomethyl ester cyclase
MTRQLKIGFIQAKNEIDVNWFKPLAFGYLKTYLEKYLEVPVEMYFMENLEGFDEFDIIGISSTSQDFAIAAEIARSIKKSKEQIVIILGGHHITYLPQTLPKEVDIGVIGEGEQTFLELVRLFCDNSLQKIKQENLEKIDGIVFHGDHGPTVTSCRKLIEPLDNIPIPFRPKSDKIYLFTSRGCPYRCTFCSSSAFWKKTRFFSAEYVVAEIESLLCQFSKLRHISIWDDLFIANLPRLRKIVSLLAEKGINKKVNFDLAVRANLVNDELCELLKTMNAMSVAFGAESASNRILELLNKGVTVQTNQKAIDTLHRYGFQVGCSLVIGCPTETEEEVRNTYEFILRNIKEGKISPQCSVNILSPMPGTKIWDDAVKDGLLDIQNMDWTRLAVFASYRNSNIEDFSQWLQCRRKNNSIYLAESSLPQEQLYKLMSHYEQIIKELEMGKYNSGLKNSIASKKLIRFLPEGTSRRKIAKAFYFLIFDRNKFRTQLTAYMRSKNRLRSSSSATAFTKSPIRFLLRRFLRRLAYLFTVATEKYNTRPAEYMDKRDLLGEFINRCRAMHKPRVLETGTKRSIPERSTRHDDWVPNAREYLGSDIEPGVDVQVVADAHQLSEVVGEEQFDIIISCSTFEHLKYPHLAAHQLMKTLKIGGILYIHTHQSFPLHAFPHDYFRFSREALAGLFGTKMGFRVIATGYSLPISLYSPHLLDHDASAFINVHIYGEKIDKTPNEYIYEFDIKNEQQKEQFSTNTFPESALAHKYCAGKGLEIGGSAHNPFGLNTLNVDFTDSMDTKFKKEEVELCGQALKVDIVANGDDIPLPDESQDFIVSSHVIEHFPDPIKALIEWDRLVKPGGIIFMIVPHKERTFDKERDCTALEHLVEDFENHNTQPHGDPNGHDHCWITGTFVEFIKYMIENLGMQWEIAEVQDTDDKVGNGFTVVIRKTGTRKSDKKSTKQLVSKALQ